jgi:hypothetical protein
MLNSQHNHESILAEAHSILRNLIMTSEIKSEISRQIVIQTSFSKILSSLRILDINEDIVDANANVEKMINSMIKARDIYNIRTQMRRNNLESLTSIQILIRELNASD